MKVSVLISAFNQHELTRLHVQECFKGTLVPDEVIVVNDGGDPSLREMLSDVQKGTSQLFYARIGENIPWNYTGARNLGFWASRGDVIISEDNDNIPSRRLYEAMVERVKDGKMIQGERRPVISKEQALTVPLEEWSWQRTVDYHRDSFAVTRMDWLKMKGYDERFAGEYGWCSTDWRRRAMRAGIKEVRCGEFYYTVKDLETKVCDCGKTKEERRKSNQCPDCGYMYKKLSYRNWRLARKNTYVQPPGSVLNFSYDIEEL
ncbi:MAG: glycosyltransferase [Candidatus Pacearchaeota archaeon]|nr:glycosyltransferase [Candidatus Pacearchaeota archaeon]